MPLRRFHAICVGGTFDRLHAGHRALLQTARQHVQPQGRVIVGVTTSAMLSAKTHAALIQPLAERCAAVRRFLESEVVEGSETWEKHSSDCVAGQDGVKKLKSNVDFEIDIVELSDVGGPSLTDSSLEAIVVSPETRASAEKVNSERVSKGFKPLEIVEISYIGHEASERLSSTYLRTRDYEALQGLRPRVMFPQTRSQVVKAVVVDGGGVILNGMPEPMLRALVADGGPLSDLDAAAKKLVVGAHKSNYHAWAAVKLDSDYSENNYWSDLVKGTPMEGRLTAEELARYLRQSFRAFDEVVAVIREARDAGAVVGVVSNHATGWFEEMAQSFGLLQTFEASMMIVSQTVKIAKPDEAIWAEMMRRIVEKRPDCTRNELVFVDDKLENVEAAVKYGCIGVVFDNTKHAAEQLRETLEEAGVSFAKA